MRDKDWLLPPWATDQDIGQAAAWMLTEIEVTLHAAAQRRNRAAAQAKVREQQTRRDADRLAAESQALLDHITEGWRL